MRYMGGNTDSSDDSSRSPNIPEQAGQEDSLWDTVCLQLHLKDPDGARRVFEAYSEQLVRLASNHIDPALRRRFDGDDVVQSVFRTFFRRLDDGSLNIHRSEHLWKLLVTITLCKTRSHARRHRAQCRDAKREAVFIENRDILANAASTEDVLALWDEIRAVTEGLPARTADVISLRLEGNGKAEIARKLGITRQTVHRLLSLVESRLAERLENLGPDSEES